MTQPTEIVRLRCGCCAARGSVPEKVFESAVGAGALAWAGLQPAPRTPYNAQLVGTNRRFTWVRGNLDESRRSRTSWAGPSTT